MLTGWRTAWGLVAVFLLTALACRPVRALDQAGAGSTSSVVVDPHGAMADTGQVQALVDFYAHQDRTAFERGMSLDALRVLSVEHLDQLKIVDSWARQSVYAIRHRQAFDGKDSVYLALDLAFRPEAWLNRNIIYVESVPIREELGVFVGDAAEARRIRQQALVSPVFLLRQPVMQRLNELEADSRYQRSVDKVYTALDTFLSLEQTWAILPPPGERRGSPWIHPGDAVLAERSAADPAASPSRSATSPTSYTADQRLKIRLAYMKYVTGWRANDLTVAQQGLADLVALAPAIDAAAYPPAAKRQVELWYNRSYSGTLVAFAYFAATVLFLLVAIGGTSSGGKVRRAAMGCFGLALSCHILAMAVRWWLNGRIPIQNQFESVMGSACIGCVVGFLLESWRRNGIFGTALSFVGFLATTVLLASPFVFGTDLGAAPGKVAGILNTGWLYIHVNIVIASYALILASAAIAVIYLTVRHLGRSHSRETESAPDIHTDALLGEPDGNFASDASTEVAIAPARTLAAQRRPRTDLLAALDQAHVVVLQLAMWLLGAGIICGAVWADQSWGRPWGWDPKETFALVTWIVYLIIVHVRLVAKTKAEATAWLSLAGCGVMLFNWIGVNFFLAGLHSYA
jgi:cytochrome c-type biogenesis protein CcsB